MMLNFPTTDAFKKVLDKAQEVATKLSSGEIGTEHILYAIVLTKNDASDVLSEVGIGKQSVESILKQENVAVSIVGQMDFTDRVRQHLFSSHRLAQSIGSGVVAPEHVLYIMLQDVGSMCFHILKDSGVDINKILQKLQTLFEQNNKQPTTSKLPAQLKEMGSDITQKAREHKIDPIIGRKDEIDRIIQILCRKTKNNPVLIGEPGVGKSAVVEGLAKAIVDGTVPEILKDKIIFSLDLGSLMAGT
ncbi:MAG: NDP-hexose 4-ketoreductase, partial [Firmicutes bacterium]|nr:NDP-hexose 4-ketoreductase [Bacillota bacterium]